MPTQNPPNPPKKTNDAKLFSSTGIVSVMTLLSRVLGLARDILVAQTFGAGSNADAFFVAFKIPNFLRRLFGEGAFAQAFVPVLSEYKTNATQAETQQLVNRVFGALGGTTILISALAVAGAPLLVWLFAPGFSAMEEKMQLATEMMRFTFPYLFFISMVAAASSVLNAYRVFAPGAFAPVVLNLCLIFSVIFVADHLSEPIMALAGGVLISGFLQLLLQMSFLKRINLLPKPEWNWQDPGVKRILNLMLPALLGVSVSQINLLLDTVLASFLTNGSVSWLYYSDRLIELPLGIFGIAIGTVILPQLSQNHSQKDPQAFSATMDWGLKLIFLFALPATIALILMAEPILISLFQYGEFKSTDVFQSAASLRAYATGLLSFMLIKVFAPGFYARQDMRTPVKIAIFAMLSNMVFNLILVWPLAHAGLALATGLSATLNAGLLYYYLHKKQIYHFNQAWIIYIVRLVIALVGMIITLFTLLPTIEQWFSMALTQRITQLVIQVFLGASVYFGLLFIVGLRPKHFSEPRILHQS